MHQRTIISIILWPELSQIKQITMISTILWTELSQIKQITIIYTMTGTNYLKFHVTTISTIQDTEQKAQLRAVYSCRYGLICTGDFSALSPG
jgi:hypothetical protein